MATKTKREAVLGMDVEISERMARKREADIEYMSSYTQQFLQRLKNEPARRIMCSKAYANYFGTTYTALYNTVPVTVKFDGTEQVFPESVANWLLDKFIKVTESNIPKVSNEVLSE